MCSPLCSLFADQNPSQNESTPWDDDPTHHPWTQHRLETNHFPVVATAVLGVPFLSLFRRAFKQIEKTRALRFDETTTRILLAPGRPVTPRSKPDRGQIPGLAPGLGPTT